jgi:hypothetical protein
MFYVVQKDFDANGQQTASEDVDMFEIEAHANAKIERLYEPCRTIGSRYMHDDGGWSVFYIEVN